MSDLIEKLSDLRSQFNCFDENKYEAYRTLSEAIKVISERPEPCEDDKGCSNCMYSGRPTYKSPCSECHDNSQWEMKPISRSHENGTECEDAISRQDALDILDGLQIAHEQGEYSAYERYRQEMCAVPSVAPKPQIGELVVRECEDTVSREAVIEEIKVCFNMGGCDCGQCNSIIEHINSLPPVTPKRKTGKWITESLADDFAFVYSLKCSECGKYYGWEHNFCPNCGADMR